jgi:TadE-like protein
MRTKRTKLAVHIIKKRLFGAGLLEFTLIAPVVLLLGLGTIQIGMLMHAKSALTYALQEAARQGAVSGGDINKIEQGLAAGLIPFRGGASNLGDLITAKAKMLAEIQVGRAARWIVIQQLSPTTNTFTDWAEDTQDDAGNTVKEIPNANLAYLRCNKAPLAGTAGNKASTACTGGAGEAIGVQSLQTLADANLLKLRLTYGVKVSVPLIGPIVAKTLEMIAGCATPGNISVGATNFGTPAAATNLAPSECFFYQARDPLTNAAEPRLPVSVEVTVRMQSPLRTAGNGSNSIIGARTATLNTTGPTLGNGTVAAASTFAPVAVATLNPNGVTYANDTQKGTGDGKVGIGSNADYTQPGGTCSAPPASNTNSNPNGGTNSTPSGTQIEPPAAPPVESGG